MNNLIFLANKLQNPIIQKEMNLPLDFICFGITNGKLYKYFGNKDCFISQYHNNKEWSNSVVYGSIFLCNDFDFYSRILDSYHLCSLSTLYRNHSYDVQHRIDMLIRPIFFNTLDELASLKYRESEEGITTQMYIANLKNPKVNRRIHDKNTKRFSIDTENFKSLFLEVNK